jgi:NADH:ubiquinone oxidoreductase subunit H
MPVACALAAAACQPASGPALVEVSSVLSTRLREGDVLELRGESFPEGRAAEVTLRGEVSRPGHARTRRFELSLPGRSVGAHTVAVDVTRPVERTLTGSADAAHATFHGSIEVSFPPRVARTPPVTGVLPDVTLDFIPAEGDASALTARQEEGRKFAEFAGILLADDQAVPTVAGVMPSSVAERGGVAAGDRLLELAGVRVLGVDDLVPPPRARGTELVVGRAGSDGRRLVLDVSGFRPLSSRDWGLAAGLVAGALSLLFLLVSPFGRALSFVEHRLSERLRSRDALESPASSSAPRKPALGSRLVGLLPSGVASYVVFAASSAILAANALGIPLVAREVDLPALVVLSFTALAFASLVFGAPGERGVLTRARRAALVVVQALPALAALGCLGMTVGSFGPDALWLAQGALPWEWLAFRSPVLLGAALLLVLSLVPEASRGRSLDTVLGARRAPPSPGHAATAAAGSAQLLLGSGVAAQAFFGGPALPGVGHSLVPSFGVALGGVALLLLKSWAIAAAVAGLRWTLGRVDIDEVRGLTLRVGLPVAAVLLGLAALAQQAPFEHLLAVTDRGMAWACLAGWLTLGALIARRVAPGRTLAPSERGPNPWL